MITKRKTISEQQSVLHQESEVLYRTMIEAAPVSIMAIRDGRFLSVNPAGCRMLGYSDPDELIGSPMLTGSDQPPASFLKLT